jgi:hypothetical protein
MRQGSYFEYPNRYGTAAFEVIPPNQYSSRFSNKMLDIDIKDKMGLVQMNILMPDRKAYELYLALDNAYNPSEGSPLPSDILRTIELPPIQHCRHSLILYATPDSAEVTILKVNILTGQSDSAVIEMMPDDNYFMGFMGYMYLNFEMPALKNDVPGEFYYNHIMEY